MWRACSKRKHGKSWRRKAPMTIFAFAGLMAIAVIAVVWGSTAMALRQSQQEQVVMEETGTAPGWSITPAHLRMW